MDLLPFPKVLSLIEHWVDSPPANEMLYMLASVYTTWRPGRQHSTPEQIGEAVAAMGGVSLPAGELPAWMRVSLEALKVQGKPN